LALKTASQKLLTSTDFFARTSTVSDDTKLAASVTSTAQTGNYAIAIHELAKVGQETLVGVADHTAQNLSGTFTIQNATTNPTGFTVSIDTAGMSLAQLRDAINSDANNAGKVTATIVDTGSGANRYRLQVKGNVTGTTNDFDVTATASLTLDTDTNVTFAAGDASLTVDGVAITRSSNTVADVISGATLTLKAQTTTAATLTINNDTAAMQANIKAFAAAYNDVRSYIDAKSVLDQKKPENNGPFLSDSTVRTINTRLQQLMTEAVAGLDGNSNALNDLGITTGTDGKLTVDDTKLSSTLATNAANISKIFIGNNSISGIATRVNEELANVTNPVGGLIDIRMDGLQGRVTSLTDRITVMERRLTNYESTLVRQFTALEQLVGSLQSQGNALGGLPSSGR